MAMSDQQFNVLAEAEKLRREHGPQALDLALNAARRHLNTAEWRAGAMWLQVVNHLRATASTQPTFNLRA